MIGRHHTTDCRPSTCSFTVNDDNGGSMEFSREQRLLRYIGSTAASMHESGTSASEDDLLENRLQAGYAQRRAKIVEVFRKVFEETMAFASDSENAALLEPLQELQEKTHLTDEELKKWEYGNFGESEKRIAATRVLIAQFHTSLGQARSEKLLGPRGEMEWLKLFTDRTISYKKREALVTKALPKWMKDTRTVLDRRDTLLKLPRVKDLPKDKVPRVAEFLDRERFVELKLGEQKSLVAMIKAALSS